MHAEVKSLGANTAAVLARFDSDAARVDELLERFTRDVDAPDGSRPEGGA